MPLRILAVSAPQHFSGELGSRVLASADPVSLYNACRHAAARAESGNGAWGESNWSTDRRSRRDSMLLLHNLDRDLSIFETRLQELRPQLLLIGAMTICLPGAIAIARRARDVLADRACIVLGGWHATESIYRERGSAEVRHHVSSPLRLMAEGAIPDDLFDIVISGDAGELITRIGEVPELVLPGGRRVAQARLGEFTAAGGDWIAGHVRQSQIHTVVADSRPRDLSVPSAPALFGIGGGFAVFNGRPTAHVFSEISRGCVYDCSFCSERVSSVGMPANFAGGPERLHAQLLAARNTALEDFGSPSASAFVEDSILLEGAASAIQRFVSLARDQPTGVTFGCQLTIDQILTKRELVRDLASVGLTYVFVGLETLDPTAIGGLSKDIRPKLRWADRMSRVLETLEESDVACGVAVLFGLGEGQGDRLALLERLTNWCSRHPSLQTVSLNWAVQHPLRGSDGGCNYRYLDWALPDEEWLRAFQHFGEASVPYSLAGRRPPRADEVRELNAVIDLLPTTAAAVV